MFRILLTYGHNCTLVENDTGERERERESNDPFREEMSRWSVTLNRVALMPQAGRAALTNPRLLSIVDEYSVLRAAVATPNRPKCLSVRPSVRPSVRLMM